MRIPFTHIHFKLTTAEKVGSGLAAVGGWMAFSAAFSTAPIWATLIAIPTTVAAGVGAVKVAKAGYRAATNYINDYAEEHPESKIGKWFGDADYQPDADADLSDDLSDDEDSTLEQDEVVNMIGDLGDDQVTTYGQGFINNVFRRATTRAMEPADDADYTSQPAATTRSGKSYR